MRVGAADQQRLAVSLMAQTFQRIRQQDSAVHAPPAPKIPNKGAHVDKMV